VKVRNSIQLRTMLLFCAAAGILLVGSFVVAYILFDRAVRDQLDRQLTETAGPIIADQIADPEEKDVDQLSLPEAYFEVVDQATGRVLQRSRNLKSDLPLHLIAPVPEQPFFETLSVPELGELRVALIPFQVGSERWALVVAGPTREVRAALNTFTRFAFLLLAVSLALMAVVSAFYARKLDLVVGQLRQFVSDASHELKTPLAVLRGETELLLTRPRSTKDYEQALRIIDGELKTLSRIVEGLFTLSMADAGQLKFAAEQVCLDDVLEESVSLAAPLARARDIQIERNFQHGVVVPGDPTFLRQLFLIFIDNAIKYSPAGRLLRVNLEVGSDVRVSFEDQGIGIAREDVARIFERFFRVAQRDAIDSQSGGLGLAIAQAIVRAHGGSIECQSELGVGSIFTVRLPLVATSQVQFQRP
jgi:signal transduction histidine kinase